ncbi:MAG: GNAT family N-acetyltransferase [Propionibacteriaceae bacterium]
MIRFDVDIRLLEVDAATARTAIEGHHRKQPFSGDFFLPSQQLGARHLAIEVDGEPVGVAAVDDDSLSLCTLDPAVKKFDRQVLEVLLAESGATKAWAASWDRHHVDLFGNFAHTIDNQAYQFELLRAEDLCRAVPGLSLTPASAADLPYLDGTEFQQDFADLVNSGRTQVARLGGTEVGIAILVPHILNRQRVDIGMFTNPESRRMGIGRSILALAATEVLAQGKTPVAGCGWSNWVSRPTIEAAGLTCIGTIFRFTLDPNRFRTADEAARPPSGL